MQYGKCQNCGAINPIDAEKCRVCGVKFNRDVAKCEKCGNLIPLEAEVCPYCGTVFTKENLKQQLKASPPVIYPAHPKPKKRGGLWTGMLIGFIIGILVSLAVAYPFVISPMQEKNAELKELIGELRQEYASLSIENAGLISKNEALILDYNDLNRSFQQKTREYNTLLMNYTELSEKYDSLMSPPSDLKFIVVLYFQSDYFNSRGYWLYMKINVSDFMKYRAEPHPALTDYSGAVDYVVVDRYIEEIVKAVKGKLVEGTGEELVDALMSISQNKGEVKEEVSTTRPETGTYYNIDTTLKYPLETLVMHSGECMDDVILFQSLVKAAGLSGAFIFIPEENHVKGGVELPSEPVHSTPFFWDNYEVAKVGDYYPAEITSYGWKIGQIGKEEVGKRCITIPVGTS